MMYDPPSGWKYGFPKVYTPLPGETLEETLLRDGYPQYEIDAGMAKHCRFLGSKEEIMKAGVEVIEISSPEHRGERT